MLKTRAIAVDYARLTTEPDQSLLRLRKNRIQNNNSNARRQIPTAHLPIKVPKT